MKDYGSVIIVAAVIAAYWIGTVLYKRKLANDLTMSMVNSDVEKYREILYSKRALLLLNPNVISLFKAMDQYSQGKMEEAEKTLKLVQLKRLGSEHLLNYFQLRSMIVMNRQDGAAFKAIRDELQSIRSEKNAEVVDAMLKENSINDRLYFQFDVSVIKELKSLIEESDESARGALMMSLAKAYHLNGQDKEAKETLMNAKGLLQGTIAEEMIDAALNDLSMLDN